MTQEDKWLDVEVSNGISVPFALVCWLGGLVCKTLAIQLVAGWFFPGFTVPATSIIGAMLIYDIALAKSANGSNYISRRELMKGFLSNLVFPWVTTLVAWLLHFGIR